MVLLNACTKTGDRFQETFFDQPPSAWNYNRNIIIFIQDLRLLFVFKIIIIISFVLLQDVQDVFKARRFGRQKNVLYQRQ